MSKKDITISILLFMTATLLMLSWLIPSLAVYWHALDTKAFYYFNGWIGTNHSAQLFWALANFRPFDLIPICIIVLSMTLKNVFFDKDDIQERSFQFVILIAVMFILRYVVSACYGDGRFSPSTVLSPAYLLTSLVPAIPSKDFAFDSFPSDHSAVMFTWMGFMLVYANKPYKYLAIPISIFFSLPRLVSGAHWISDILVGSVFVTLLSITLVCYTPFCAYVKGWASIARARLVAKT